MVARASLSAEGVKDNYELSLVFCDDDLIRQLNQQYRGLDSATDVLSFPQDQEGEVGPEMERERNLGDIIISVPTAERQAAGRGYSLEEELTQLIIHGTLHLLGYDDEYEDDAARMHAREAEIREELRRRARK